MFQVIDEPVDGAVASGCQQVVGSEFGDQGGEARKTPVAGDAEQGQYVTGPLVVHGDTVQLTDGLGLAGYGIVKKYRVLHKSLFNRSFILLF